jgi:hypothetical protein
MTVDRADLLRRVLADRLEELRRARDALERSYRRVGGPDMIDVLSQSDDGLVELEAFTARFARLTDILVQQVLRAIDELEGQDPAAPLDRIQRAEKRAWVASASEMIEARNLRNRIAHDYDAEGWRQIARLAYTLVPQLLLSAERTLGGSARLIRPSS